MVVVVDDMDRENEGDLIMAADKVKTEDMAFIVRYSSGVVCIAMESDRLEELELPQMVPNNQVCILADGGLVTSLVTDSFCTVSIHRTQSEPPSL